MPYDLGRHDGHTRAHQHARYRLRGGIARMAIQAKVEGKPVEDSVGRPMKYCNEMADRHGLKTLEKWARGATMSALAAGMDFCSRCHRVPEACRCRA